MSQTLQKRLRLWAWRLLVAVVSSVGDAGAAFLVAPHLIEQHWRELWPVLAFTTVKSALLYMKQYPLPAFDDAEEDAAVAKPEQSPAE